MADNGNAPAPVARWFKLGAIASVLFMVLGCASYLMQMTLDTATLPLDQRAMMDAVPSWMNAAFAVAVWVGLAGSVMLLMRKKLAEPLLLVSLIAVLVQFSAYFIDPELSEAVPADGLVIPVIIVIITWTVFWFARHSKQRGWLA